MERISLQELVAINNTPKAKALVVKYGYEPAKDYEDLTYKLFRLIKDYRDEGLKDLAELHPHKDLILNYFGKTECECDNKPLKIRKRIGKKYSNFAFEDDYLDVTGDSENKEEKTIDNIGKYMPMIAIAGIFAIAIVSLKR